MALPDEISKNHMSESDLEQLMALTQPTSSGSASHDGKVADPSPESFGTPSKGNMQNMHPSEATMDQITDLEKAASHDVTSINEQPADHTIDSLGKDTTKAITPASLNRTSSQPPDHYVHKPLGVLMTALMRATQMAESPHIWTLLQKWLKSCISYHGTCNSIGDDNWTPTRLLEIRGSGTSTEVYLRSAPFHNGVRYVVLTHRWGPPETQRLRLERNTLDTLMNGVCIAKLSRTFRDAIKVTSQLEVQYIWIDSLCIIQDDEDDWRRESNQMGQIYENGYLNLSSLLEENESAAFLSRRDSSHVTPLVIDRSVQTDDTAKIYVVVPSWFWYDNVEAVSVNKRGWMYQERLLSPRTAYFSGTQLFWECREQKACESFPNGLPYGVGDFMSQVPTTKILSAGPHMPLLMAALGINPASFWNRMIGEYSKCHLTFHRDRLIALAGIATKMHKVLQTDYIAGLWRNQLPYALLWHTDDEIDDHYRPLDYLAPSWSWASVTCSGISMGSVHIERDGVPNKEKECVAILSHDIRLVSEEQPFGQVAAGHIHVRGRLGVAKWVKTPCEWIPGFDLSTAIPKNPYSLGVRKEYTHITLTNELLSDMPVSIAEPKHFDIDSADADQMGQDVILDDRCWSHLEAACFLPLTIAEEDCTIKGLLLVKQHEAEKFERIGYISFRDQQAQHVLQSLSEHELIIV